MLDEASRKPSMEAQWDWFLTHEHTDMNLFLSAFWLRARSHSGGQSVKSIFFCTDINMHM